MEQRTRKMKITEKAYPLKESQNEGTIFN